MTYEFPLTALPGKNRDTITVATAANDPVKVLRVEVSLCPGS